MGIEQSHSRPHTANDNPFSEAHFKTMKYRPDYPHRFESFAQAQRWAHTFFTWYNEQHYHSGLNLFTPSSVHYGESLEIHARRQSVLEQAFAIFPERFAKGKPVVRGIPSTVWLNPPPLLETLS
jgi:hypothetical protein